VKPLTGPEAQKVFANDKRIIKNRASHRVDGFSAGKSQLQSSVGSRAFQNARLQKQARKQAEVLLPAAVKACREGRHLEAQTLCRQILNDLPNHFDALHLLGATEIDCGRFDEAAAVLARAVNVEPRSAEAQSNLGIALFKLNRYEEARACQEKAIALKPNFPSAITNLGNAMMHMRMFEQAISAHDRAIALKPDYADAHCNRGMALVLLNRNEEADQNFDRALLFNPRLQSALFGKAVANMNLRNFDLARLALDATLAATPDNIGALSQRGRLFLQLGQLDKAEADYDAALAVEPKFEPALCGKAHVAIKAGTFSQALSACHRALGQNPNSEVALTLLGACFAAQGEIAAAIEYFDRALAIKPDLDDAHNRKIFALDYLPGMDFERLQGARKSWWDAIGAKVPRRQLRERNLDPDRRIVLGYVSSEFHSHSAAIALLPVLLHHDHAKFEIIGYSCIPAQDVVTAECRRAVDRWVDTWQLSDDKLADRIEADQVDILIDVSGHTAENRLPVFARKPAPVQVSGFGHATGTGLPVMDYVLSDPVTIPQAVRHLFAEKIHDLPALITIAPAPPDIPPTPLPMLRNGYVTFGMFNRIEKISDPALEVWSRLLRSLPGSIITVKSGALNDPLLRDRLIARFAARGLTEDRVRYLGSTSRHQHLAMFGEIDIALDPFPQNGGISTWEPLQMGVPVVTKLGTGGPAARAGASIVKAVGLDDWVATDDDGYIAIAQRYASNPAELSALRASLPAMVANSAAGNCEVYTRHVEEGYRKFWRDYCGSADR
jgi:predicted O-linked N-acetylglucosamine transferase (SPINDLY family)